MLATAEGKSSSSSARVQHLAKHIIMSAPAAAAVATSSEQPMSVSHLEVGAPAVLGPTAFIMGSPGNRQTEDGIVLSEEELAIQTLLAAMHAGIADFVRVLSAP